MKIFPNPVVGLGESRGISGKEKFKISVVNYLWSRVSSHSIQP